MVHSVGSSDGGVLVKSAGSQPLVRANSVAFPSGQVKRCQSDENTQSPHRSEEKISVKRRFSLDYIGWKKSAMEQQKRLDPYPDNDVQLRHGNGVHSKNKRNLQSPHSMNDEKNGGEQVAGERPFSFPPNLHLSSSSAVDTDAFPRKRSSFIRQGFNSLRKSLRFKNSRKEKVEVDVDIDVERKTNANSNGNKFKASKIFEETGDMSSIDAIVDVRFPKNKHNKHFRNHSTSSYFNNR